MSIDTATRLTPEDLLSLPDGKDYELVDGQLVERSMSEDSSWIAAEISYLLRSALDQATRESRSGWIFGADQMYRCFPDDGDRVRKADVSLILASKLPQGPR